MLRFCYLFKKISLQSSRIINPSTLGVRRPVIYTERDLQKITEETRPRFMELRDKFFSIQNHCFSMAKSNIFV